jgi:hypothetical protein
VAVQRPAAQRPVADRPVFVVAQAGFVVGEEDLADQVAAAAHPGLVEHTLQVLLDGVRRNHQALGDLGGGVALQHQAGDVLFALGQPVGGHQQGSDAGRVGRLDDDGDAAGAAGDQGGAVEHDPGARARQHPRDRDLPRLVGVLGGP